MKTKNRTEAFCPNFNICLCFFCIEFLVGINRQNDFLIYAFLIGKPRSHAWIFTYRTWAIEISWLCRHLYHSRSKIKWLRIVKPLAYLCRLLHRRALLVLQRRKKEKQTKKEDLVVFTITNILAISHNFFSCCHLGQSREAVYNFWSRKHALP